MDELDMLRRPGERVVWRETPVWRWQWMLFVFLALVVAGIMGMIDMAGLKNSAWIFIFGVAVVLMTGGGSVEEPTLITEDRILRLGRRRGFRGGRRDPAYATPLAEVGGVSLRDTGFDMCVELHRADSGGVDVLPSNQPQALAAAIAEAAGLGKAPRVGRLEHVADLCSIFGLMMLWIARPWIQSMITGPLGLGPLHDFTAGLVIVFVVMFVWVLGTLLVAVAAVLFMPFYATAEEAGTWFRLKPSRRLIRWLGWKSRPYAWLARLVYGSALTVSDERST